MLEDFVIAAVAWIVGYILNAINHILLGLRSGAIYA